MSEDRPEKKDQAKGAKLGETVGAVLIGLVLAVALLFFGGLAVAVVRNGFFATHATAKAWEANVERTSSACVSASQKLGVTLSAPGLVSASVPVATDLSLAHEATVVQNTCGSLWSNVSQDFFLGTELPAGPVGTNGINSNIQSWGYNDVYTVTQAVIRWSESANPVSAILDYDSAAHQANVDLRDINAQAAKVGEGPLLYAWPHIPARN